MTHARFLRRRRHTERLSELAAPEIGIVAEPIRALRAIHEGQSVVAPPLPGLSAQGHQVPNEADMLTARERETLAFIATGRSNDEIAQEMRISLNSVKSYIRSAYRKTGVHSRSQAVLWAVTHGVRVEVLQDA